MTGSSIAPELQTELPPDQFICAESMHLNRYFLAHPMLVPFLRSAYPVIRRHFPDMQIILEVMSDPEGGSGMLFGLMQTPEAAEETLRRLDGLDNDPEWIVLYTLVRSLCIIRVEYI